MTTARTHVLESGPETVSPGVLDPSRPPALTIAPGDIVSCPDICLPSRRKQAHPGAGWKGRPTS